MQKPPFLLKLLPSLGDFAFLMPAVFLFGRMDGVQTILADCDTGWHIRAGEWILANRAVPSSDFFSYSKAGSPWFAWEWLSEVLMAGLHNRGGLQAVVLFGVLLISTVVALVYRMSRRGANPLVAMAVTILAGVASSIHWLARPHLFTLLFVVMFYAALERMRAGESRWAGVPYLAILPAVTVVWANLHGGFFVGALMCLVYAAGELAKIVFATVADRRTEIRAAGQYTMCALACLAASLINPYTYQLHTHMVNYLRDPYASKNIAEFLSPSFHHPTAAFFEVLLVLAAASACWNLAKGRFTEPMLLGMWAHGALLATRNIPIFAIVAAPMVARSIQEALDGAAEGKLSVWLSGALEKFRRVGAETAETESVGRWHLVPAAGMLAVAALLWAPHPPKKFRAEFDPATYPAEAVSLLRKDATARIFTHDEWGDYLIWSMYPSHKVFVDGRSDFYGNAFEEQYMDVLNAKHGWEEVLERFGVNTILLPPNLPFAGALKESSRWRVTYDDGVAVIFQPVRNSGGTQISVAQTGGGTGRDREITKTKPNQQTIKNHIKS